MGVVVPPDKHYSNIDLYKKISDPNLGDFLFQSPAGIISTSRKGLNMVNLVLTKETKANVQAHCQDYPNNPI